MTFTLEVLAHEKVLATLCRLPFFCALDVMQRVRVAIPMMFDTIPMMFDAAAVNTVSLEPGLPTGRSVYTSLSRGRGADTTVMQAPSSVPLKPSMFQAEPVGLSATFTPEFVAAWFEQRSGIQAMTSVTFLASFPLRI
ncbi:hypothetical protein MRX96_019480 [Rhipicephalus microplus]